MKGRTLVIGTRGSALALWQARWVEERIRALAPAMSLSVRAIRTKGDSVLDAPLAAIGDRGLFTRDIEHALLDGTIDCAVHSLKDLPTSLPDGLVLGAVCEREDVRDVFMPHPSNPVRTLLGQEEGAVIATGSLRRKCQLLAARRDFRVVDLRGNLNTRMEKLSGSAWAGIILARAGVARMGWLSSVGETIPTDVMLPAVGQGAIAVEIRAHDREVAPVVAGLNHAESAAAVLAERSLLGGLEGGCQVPIGAYARVEEGTSLRIDAMVASLDGGTVIRGRSHGSLAGAASTGSALARTLLEAGAAGILESIRAGAPGS